MIDTKEKRAEFFAETDAPKAQIKIEMQNNLTTAKAKFNRKLAAVSLFRTSLCSFCRCVLPDDSIRFNFTAACPKCLEKIEKFTSDLRKHKGDYAKKFGGGNALQK